MGRTGAGGARTHPLPHSAHSVAPRFACSHSGGVTPIAVAAVAAALVAAVDKKERGTIPCPPTNALFAVPPDFEITRHSSAMSVNPRDPREPGEEESLVGCHVGECCG